MRRTSIETDHQLCSREIKCKPDVTPLEMKNNSSQAQAVQLCSSTGHATKSFDIYIRKHRIFKLEVCKKGVETQMELVEELHNNRHKHNGEAELHQ